MLADFQTLAMRCEDEGARDQIVEAVHCYEAGSYRAAIVTAYVAITFDLISKLNILSSSGDAAAALELATLANLRAQQDKNDPAAISGLLEFERNLLELFRDKFEFLGFNEFEELARLRQDRNRCAHPTFTRSDLPFSPTAELARLHIRNAVELVLSQPPKQGKAALASLQAVILSSHFPTKLEDAVNRLRTTELRSPRESLVRALVDDLVFGWATPTSSYYKKSPIPMALQAVIEIARGAALERATIDVEKLLASADDEANRRGVYLCIWVTELGERINAGAQTVVSAWLAKLESNHLGGVIRRAMKLPWLREDAIKLVDKLTSAQIAGMKGELPREIISRAAQIYAESGGWTAANVVATESVIPNVAAMSEADIRLILKAASDKTADLQGSHGFRDFIDAVYDRSPIAELLEKLLLEYDLQSYSRASGGNDIE